MAPIKNNKEPFMNQNQYIPEARQNVRVQDDAPYNNNIRRLGRWCVATTAALLITTQAIAGQCSGQQTPGPGPTPGVTAYFSGAKCSGFPAGVTQDGYLWSSSAQQQGFGPLGAEAWCNANCNWTNDGTGTWTCPQC